jgi:hypothetical protein
MTEVEQLRAEVNRLRERIAVLEARGMPTPVDLSRYQQPVFVGDPVGWASKPLYTCCPETGWPGPVPVTF